MCSWNKKTIAITKGWMTCRKLCSQTAPLMTDGQSTADYLYSCILKDRRQLVNWSSRHQGMCLPRRLHRFMQMKSGIEIDLHPWSQHHHSFWLGHRSAARWWISKPDKGLLQEFTNPYSSITLGALTWQYSVCEPAKNSTGRTALIIKVSTVRCPRSIELKQGS